MIRDRDLDRRRWVEPESDDELDQATWERIDARLTEGPKRTWLVPASVGVVLAAAAAMWLVLQPSNAEWNEGELVASADAIVAVMEDGSSVEAAPHSRLVRQANQGDDMHVQVAEGEASFDVARNAARDFVVHAGEVEVVVVGTRFRVERGDVVVVAVSYGAVEIRHEGASVIVSAGEIWREPEDHEDPEEAAEPAVAEVAGAPATELEVEPSEEEAGEPEVSAPATRPSAVRVDPAELFEAAQGARRDGRHDEASEKYGEFLRHFPSHTNASLAAFELGRLKMDVLHDPAGAARAFERAARRGSPFRQDAMARQAQALAASGDGDGCTRARTRYEEAFPSGRHLASLAHVCE